MGYSIVNNDIAKIKADAIINASNGIGYMGGFIGRYIKLNGVAESLHYASNGFIEKAAKKQCSLNSYNPGDIFVTTADKLNTKYIIHAVTMKKPGSKSDINIVKTLLPKIIEKACDLNVKSIAIPLLGTGTGKVNKNNVLDIYKKVFTNIFDLDVIIVLK